MQLGISTYTYTWAIGVPGHEPAVRMNAFDLLEKAKDLGAVRVQIADNLPLHALPEPVRKQIAGRAHELDLVIETGMRGIRPDALEKYIAIAEEMSSPILRAVIDEPGWTPSPDDVVAIIKPLVRQFEQRGIILAIENHDRLEASVFASIIERVDSRHVGICLDTANSFGAGEGVRTVVDCLAPHTVNLHVKDFCVRRVDHKMGFVIEGTPAGQGMLPIPQLLERLSSCGRCQSAILELWTPPEPTIGQTIIKEARWAAESFACLRTIVPRN
ncbi:sugar phosphate isomerase/epimerase [bacterium]|nr:sugar phosphate isomerase/epimerase [bacterium]